MTNNNIQQARDILAKWRANVEGKAFESLVAADFDNETGFWGFGKPELGVALIFGTAGNSDLLDAWDEGLRQYGTMPDRSVPTFIKRVAAAIVAADKRMTS